MIHEAGCRGRQFAGRRLPWLWAALTLAACGDGSTTGPVDTPGADVYVLNSTGQTLLGVSVDDGLAAVGLPFDLGGAFDGDAVDLSVTHAVTTVSSFGGSLAVFVDLSSGAMTTTAFPRPEADLANPSAPTFDATGAAWIGGRGSDAVYRVRPGDLEAERVAEGVGTFVERVLPINGRLYAIDANLDDDGGTYIPLGPGRVVVLTAAGMPETVLDLPAEALNPTDAVQAEGRLIVLAGGTLDPGTFVPRGDGALVEIDLASGEVLSSRMLDGNGISIERGGDGKVYVVTTTDFVSTTVLRYDVASRSFERGPADPIVVQDEAGESVSCWTATGLADGRLLCATFSFAEAGRLLLTDAGGGFVDEMPSGFGTTDLALR